MNYVTMLNSELAELRGKYKREVDDLTDKLNDQQIRNDELGKLVGEQAVKIDEYRQHEEAVTRLSESIGKLYLVAKANAAGIMESAKQNAEQSELIAKSTIDVTQTAHNELQGIKDELAEKIARFSDELDQLGSRIIVAERTVTENVRSVSEKSVEYEDVSHAVANSVEQ